jgi:glycosyltransferase involved in cell wall biosynthesis
LVRRLFQDDNIALYVLNANYENSRIATEEFFRALRIPFLFVPLRPMNLVPEGPWPWQRISLRMKARFWFPYELEAHNQLHVAETANQAISRWNIDFLIVDYLPATLFWRGIERVPVPKSLVTVNREADLYADMLRLGLYGRDEVAARISHWRLVQYERRIQKAFDKVVAIGGPDVPSHLPKSRTAVITSYLDESPTHWSYAANKTVFFVGNIGHYPNRLAIDYIVSELAPRVFVRDPDVKFAIIGASPDQVGSRHHHPNIELMGTSTPEAVELLFKSAALFVCPIKNTFGMKFKVAEAISYGTPFLASKETMLGFPYLEGLPELNLGNPEATASIIANLLASKACLEHLSAEVLRRHRAFAVSQKNIWSRTLFARQT